MFIRTGYLCSLIVFLTGCAAFTPPARIHELEAGKDYWFDYDATRRGTVLTSSQHGRSSKSCAEPAPDVALSLASRIESQVSYKEITAEAKGELALHAVKLAERSQMVLFFREALFRVCEMSINQSLTNKEIDDLYEKIISTALRLGSEKAFDVDLAKLKNDLVKKEAQIAMAAQERQRLQENKVNEIDYQQKIANLNGQMKQLAEEKQNLAKQILSVAKDKKAEINAVEQKAVEAKVSDSVMNK